MAKVTQSKSSPFTRWWNDTFSNPDQHEYWKLGFQLFALSFFVALLELTQDLLSSYLNGNPFSTVESLSYKLYWLLFPILVLILKFVVKRMRTYLRPAVSHIINGLLVVILSLFHLLLFSLLLYGISSLVYTESWSLYYLISEKLSTRLYLALSIYLFAYLWYVRQSLGEEPSKPDSELDKTHIFKIPIKNGTETTLIDVEAVRWITADDSYIRIHTDKKEYLKSDSLKNILTSLPDHFCRIHRSTIINANYIESMDSRGNGDYDINMNCGTQHRLSRTYASALKSRLL
jgi:hypothetical protein